MTKSKLPAKRPNHRPSSYKPEFAELARKYCLLGALDVELADFFGVSVWTVMRWARQFPEFCSALKAGKEEGNARTERSLYHRANGYTYEGEKVFQYGGKIIRAKTREHVPPDPTSLIFFLKNRAPDRWRDQQEHKHRFEETRSAAELFAELQAEAAAKGITLIPAEDGSFGLEPTPTGAAPPKTEDNG